MISQPIQHYLYRLSTLVCIGLFAFSSVSLAIPASAAIIDPTETFNLQIQNNLATTPDMISLCENGVFRKGWDGNVKGNLTESNISTSSDVSILYGSVIGNDCKTPENSWKKVKELSSLPIKFAQPNETIAITLDGTANITLPTTNIVPIADTPALSDSPNNQTEIAIKTTADLQIQQVLSGLCIDSVAVFPIAGSSNVFASTSGSHRIAFAPTPLTDVDCANIPNNRTLVATIVDGKKNNFKGETQLDYSKSAITGIMSPSSRVKTMPDKSRLKITDIDPDITGKFAIGISETGIVRAYSSIGQPTVNSKTAWQDMHRSSSPSGTFVVIDYDVATTIPSDEFSINEVAVQDLFGGATESADGVITPKDSTSGLPTGKKILKPMSFAMNKYVGHVTLIKRTEVSSMVSSKGGWDIAKSKGYVSNSPFDAVPTTYNLNAQGDYIVVSTANGPMGQYILLDSSFVPVRYGSTLLRTGGSENSKTSTSNTAFGVAGLFGVVSLLSVLAFVLKEQKN